jgi:hypothetical protein
MIMVTIDHPSKETLNFHECLPNSLVSEKNNTVTHPIKSHKMLNFHDFGIKSILLFIVGSNLSPYQISCKLVQPFEREGVTNTHTHTHTHTHSLTNFRLYNISRIYGARGRPTKTTTNLLFSAYESQTLHRKPYSNPSTRFGDNWKYSFIKNNLFWRPLVSNNHKNYLQTIPYYSYIFYRKPDQLNEF